MLPELPCEKSDAYFVLRDGASGIFLSANTFPKSRETRAVTVKELQRFKDRIPSKFHYLRKRQVKTSRVTMPLCALGRQKQNSVRDDRRRREADGLAGVL